MKKLVLVFAMVACLVGVTGQASAATTGNIAVTVSLASVTSVSVTPGTWPIGAITFDAVDLLSFSASNDGTEAINLTITGADGAGLWLIGATTGLNQFTVEAKNGTPALLGTAFFLTKTAIALNVASIGTGSAQAFDLEYTAPSSNDKTIGISQGFTVVITASAA